MPEVENAIEWDFVTLVAWWNIYGLPALLTIVAIAVLFRRHSRPRMDDDSDSSRTVRRIAFIHCALAVHAQIFLVRELSFIWLEGNPESDISLITLIISSVVNPFLAVGLLRQQPWAQRLAIVWYAILSLLAIIAIAWRWYYQVAFDPSNWPELAASRLMPFFLFVVILLPRIKRVFERVAGGASQSGEPGKPEGASTLAEPPLVWPVVSLSALLFLVVVCSNLVVDVTDWGYRLAFEPELFS